MDQIRIENLELYANHGVLKEETALGQKFIVSLRLFCDTAKAGKSDCLADSVNYSEAAHFAEQYLKEHTFQLLEAAAEHLAEAVLLEFNLIEQLEITLKKPWAPVHLPMDTVSVQIIRGWHTAYIALGSNLGDKEQYFREALRLLSEEKKIRVENVSSFIVTKPMGEVAQDDYLNGAAGIKTLLSPEELLDCLNRIEDQLGRVRTVRWGPRTMDLDLLCYEDQVIRSPRLTLPHYGIQDRDFVLRPMEEIAPQWKHPLLGQTIAQMWREYQRLHS